MWVLATQGVLLCCGVVHVCLAEMMMMQLMLSFALTGVSPPCSNLHLATRCEQERAAEERRVAAAKAARERQQHQQNKHGTKQQAPPLMQGKPGIGMLPGTTGTASAPAAGQVVAQGSVQGVVYKSKWSQQRAQTQQQTTK